MPKVKLFDKEHGTYRFTCPAGHEHFISTNIPHHLEAQWDFNGDVDKPTFTPSVKERTGLFVDPNLQGNEEYLKSSYQCHFVITDGNIFFCDDCSHDLRGTFELPEIEE